MSRTAIADAPARLFHTLFSFEALYFVVLFSGRIGASYKESALVGFIPLEPTLLAFIATLVVGLFIIGKRGWQIPRRSWLVLGPGLAFTAWATITALWSPSDIYVEQKLLEVGLILTITILGGVLIIAQDPERVTRLAHLILLFGVAIGLVVIYSFDPLDPWGYTTAFGINRLAIARVLGFSSIVALWGLLSERTRSRWPYVVAFALTFVALLMTASRMPLIATLVALTCILIMRRQPVIAAIREHRAVAIIVVAIVVVAALGTLAYYTSIGETPTILERMSGLILDPGSETNVAARAAWYAPSINQWLEQPLTGQGLAAWPILNDYPDERTYPHSIALETLSETGLIGFSLFVFFIGAAGYSLIKGLHNERREVAILVGSLLIAALLNALVTGDLGDNRFVFGFAALAPVVFSKT